MGTLLFLCTGNSCRSQMAEAWARLQLSTGWTVCSAGLEKHGLNSLMVKVMEEEGVDMASHYSKTIEELPAGVHWDVIVTVCNHAAQSCPCIPAKKVLHIPFDDPPALAGGLSAPEALTVYRRVRDEIRSTVTRLVKSLSSDVQ